MKAVITQAREVEGKKFNAGDTIECTAQEFAVLSDSGYAISESEHRANQTMVRAREASVDAAIKASKAFAPKEDTAKVRAMALQLEAITPGTGVEYINSMPARDNGILSERLTASTDRGFRANEIQFQGVSIEEASRAYIRASQPVRASVQSGDIKKAVVMAGDAGLILKQHVLGKIRVGDDVSFRDLVKGADYSNQVAIAASMMNSIKAADYSDPNTQVGTLATGLILMRNLGFLRNKIKAILEYMSVDLRNEPAKFGQPIFTRYLTVPGVLTWVPGVGFTSDSSTISTASAGTNQSGVATQASGTLTKSVPSATDVTVTMNQFKACEIEFPISTIGATVRNLFAEQREAQTYALAEHIIAHFLKTLFSATWSGTITAMSAGEFGVPGMAKLKNRLTLCKIPDIGRYALLHSTFHDSLLTDTNLLSAKAILALINKDASAFEQAEVPSMFGVKPLETQLASYASGTYTAPTISATTGAVDFTAVNQIGFAGNMSAMVFAARVPQDFTAAARDLGIPATNAVEVITDADSGLCLMVFKYVDNGKMSISTRVCLMYGAAQGHPGMGFVLTP